MLAHHSFEPVIHILLGRPVLRSKECLFKGQYEQVGALERINIPTSRPRENKNP
jgi:hypothetical protein